MTHTVRIANMAFDPPVLQIHALDTVTWQAAESGHTATADEEFWDSGFLPEGESFSMVFDTTGSYPYHCRRHPMMTGVIEVISPPPQGASPP